MRSTALLAVALGCAATLSQACGDDEQPAADTSPDTQVDDSGSDGDGSALDAGPDAADVQEGSDAAEDVVPREYTSARGVAFAFALPGEEYGRIQGEIFVLEDPSIRTTSDAEGSFEIDGLVVGSEATFVIVADGFPEGQTKTFVVPASGIDRLTFQIPPLSLMELMARLIEVELDDERCQIVSTFTRVGRSIFDPGAHGEPGATVAIEPALPAEHGPIYFNEDVLPDRTVTESSLDGGVVFVNVPPGEYRLTASKTGVEFESVDVICRAGALVNASPPYGLQALE